HGRWDGPPARALPRQVVLETAAGLDRAAGGRRAQRTARDGRLTGPRRRAGSRHAGTATAVLVAARRLGSRLLRRRGRLLLLLRGRGGRLLLGGPLLRLPLRGPLLLRWFCLRRRWADQ